MALTVSKRFENVMGSRRAVHATLTGTTTSEAWNTGLKVVTSYSIDGGSGGTVSTVTASGGTLTIGSSAGLTAASAIAWGY